MLLSLVFVCVLILVQKFTPQWEFVCASVGDCKAFCYSNGEITDITEGNRQNASDPRYE